MSPSASQLFAHISYWMPKTTVGNGRVSCRQRQHPSTSIFIRSTTSSSKPSKYTKNWWNQYLHLLFYDSQINIKIKEAFKSICRRIYLVIWLHLIILKIFGLWPLKCVFFPFCRMYGLFQTAFYFGYMALFSGALGIICGTVGYIGTNVFVRKIYSNVKID